jgi:uncharacterized protein GlcG (DUF336 family)
MLTLSKSRNIIDRAILRARQLNATISVAVCDSSGSLIALNRMDSAHWDVDRGSIGKAIAAAITGYPSDELVSRIAASGRQMAFLGKGIAARGQRGGLPIKEAGVVEGGCGVSGAPTLEQDEECARAGIAAFGTAKSDRSLEPV